MSNASSRIKLGWNTVGVGFIILLNIDCNAGSVMTLSLLILQ